MSFFLIVLVIGKAAQIYHIYLEIKGELPKLLQHCRVNHKQLIVSGLQGGRGEEQLFKLGAVNHAITYKGAANLKIASYWVELWNRKA
jgi:hypothetical protein